MPMLQSSGPVPSSLFSNHSPHPLDPQIFEAIASHDVSHLQALFMAGARPNAIRQDRGQTALAIAAEQGDRAILQCLLDQGAEVNGIGSRGETPLMAAASGGNLELVTLLLAQGARVGAMSDDGDTALCLAAGATRWLAIASPDSQRAGSPISQPAISPQLSQQLSQQPVISQQPPGITRQTDSGLEQLCPQDETTVIRVVEALLAAGAQLNRNGCSTTPLMEAARYGQLKLLAFLLQQGADPGEPAKDGQTALDIAKLYNQMRALTLLEAHSKSQHGGDDAKSVESAQVVA